MALESAKQKIAQARAEYEATLKTIGKDMQVVIADVLSKALPPGWFIMWTQSDNQYNDENYYFGLNTPMLCTEKEPRQGALLKAGRPPQYKTVQTRWGDSYKECVDHGAPDEYEYHLDDECQARENFDELGYDDEGVIEFDNYSKKHGLPFGLTDEAFDALKAAFDSIDEQDMRYAFGDGARVRIHADGRCVVTDFEGRY